MSEGSARNPLWFNFFRPDPGWVDEAGSLCRRHPLFDGIPDSVVHWFVSTMHPRHYKAEEYIFHAGDEGAGALLLLSGRVEIRHQGVVLAVMERGDIFGEAALVDGSVRTADAVTLCPSRLLFLLHADLDEWINGRPKHACTLLRNLGGMLARRLLQANRLLSGAGDGSGPDGGGG
ncbi:MAG: cyclic nucleotide-binding domain-containing protein, partial [Zetaproteobacteria bacterium]